MKFFTPNLFALLALALIVSDHAVCGTISWFYALDQDKLTFEKTWGKPLRSATSGSCTIHEYQAGPHRVVAAKMGSGCVTTAVTVSTVLALHPADRVISTGPAGLIDGEAAAGTWFRIDRVSAWQKGRAEAGSRIVPGDPVPLAADPSRWPSGEWLDFPAAAVASGEAFVASDEARADIRSSAQASLVEMNAFGLLAAVEGRNVKVLLLRVVSDRADAMAAEDFASFAKDYDGRGGAMVAALVKALPVGKDEPGAHDALKNLLEE